MYNGNKDLFYSSILYGKLPGRIKCTVMSLWTETTSKFVPPMQFSMKLTHRHFDMPQWEKYLLLVSWKTMAV